MLDFEWYRSFLAIYQAGTVTRAAQIRSVTQPALSQHLAALEAALGVPLFVRTPRRMVPTDHGHTLYTQIAPALEHLERLAPLRNPKNAPLPSVRIGAPREYFAVVGIARLRAIPLRVTVQFGVARTLVERVQQGGLDVAIASERIAIPGLTYQPLIREDFVIVGSCGLTPPPTGAGTPQERDAFADWLLTQPWLSYGPDLPLIRRVWRQSFGRRPALNPTLIMPDLLMLAETLRTRAGVTVLPRYLCQTDLDAGRLCMLWDPDPPVTNTLWLVCQTSRQHQADIELIRAALQGHTGDSGSIT